MTNPNDAVGTNGAYGGRTSVNAFNDDLAVYTAGIMSGWACSPDSGMTVTLGGDGLTRDVAIAEDNAGNKTTINNISGSPVQVTMSAAPGANSRIDAIVAYVDNPPQGSDNIADNYEACGLIAVDGTPSASPTAPDDNDIRSAITADGASGSTAYYVVLATITITSGTTDIIADDIATGDYAMIGGSNIDFATFSGNSNQVTITGSVNSNSTSYKDCSGTYTIPETGLYFLYSFVSTASATSTKFGLAGRVILDSTVISIDPVYADSYPNRSSNNFAYLYIATAFWANKDSVITLQTKMDNWTGKSTHHTTIQRIF